MQPLAQRPEREVFAFKINSAALRRLEDAAAATGRSVAEILRTLVDQFIAQTES
jgi:hypothetical protein